MADSLIIANTDSLNLLFKQLNNRLTETKPLMTEIAGIMYYGVSENFRTEGSRLPGGGWKQMQHNSRKGQILQDSGVLLSSISWTATATESVVGTNYKTAALHNFGGVIKAKKIVGSVKRKKDVFAMEQFFWMKWYESGKKDNYYKALAFHVHKTGQITVPARPFMMLNNDDYLKIEDAVVRFLKV
ncbi:MAG: hypothetical protein HF314_12080 [Ignavibacteria bacterium]|jgi:phage gpG-like protein|nr:hypothetical protein [Ignavibacteria bacterium]MCU7503809.1 hypothetical protein [Ignavibacteria bacterium]MCU7517177.1 hypothetical protein [Ignavibacteria bacterium]